MLDTPTYEWQDALAWQVAKLSLRMNPASAAPDQQHSAANAPSGSNEEQANSSYNTEGSIFCNDAHSVSSTVNAVEDEDDIEALEATGSLSLDEHNQVNFIPILRDFCHLFRADCMSDHFIRRIERPITS